MLNPKRQYYKSHGTMRRIKIPMRPPVRCIIQDKNGLPIFYNPITKTTEGPTNSFTEFHSHSRAKKALWHILQSPDALRNAPYEIVRMKS